jgi:hypothetical protein
MVVFVIATAKKSAVRSPVARLRIEATCRLLAPTVNSREVGAEHEELGSAAANLDGYCARLVGDT